MNTNNIGPGPKIGMILNALMEEVLENPKLNTSDYLEKRSSELIKLNEIELKKLAEKGKDKKEELETKELEKIRDKHKVK